MMVMMMDEAIIANYFLCPSPSNQWRGWNKRRAQTYLSIAAFLCRYRGAVYADAGDFEKCIALWMYALDMQQKHLDPLYPMILSSFLSFAELFSFMQQVRKERFFVKLFFLKLPAQARRVNLQQLHRFYVSQHKA